MRSQLQSVLIVAAAWMCLLGGGLAAEDSFTVTSPDGSVTAIVALKSLPQPNPPGR